MKFGFVEIHEELPYTDDFGNNHEVTVRKFISPKGNPLKWLIAPFVCTDIYKKLEEGEDYEEVNLSHISEYAIVAAIVIGLIIFVVENLMYSISQVY